MENYDLYSPFQYPWWSINFYCIIWFASLLTDFGLMSLRGSLFSALDAARQRKVVVYVIMIAGTSFALGAQAYGGKSLLLPLDDEQERAWVLKKHSDWINISLMAITIMYAWELTYRLQVGWPLLVNRVVMVVLIQLLTSSFFDLGHELYLRFALLVGLMASTEQPIFFSLLCLRLDMLPKFQPALFYMAAVQSLLVKTTVVVYSLYLYSVHVVQGNITVNTDWELFWKYIFVPLLLIAFGTQLYFCYMLCTLGHFSDSESSSQQEKSDGTASSPPPAAASSSSRGVPSTQLSTQRTESEKREDSHTTEDDEVDEGEFTEDDDLYELNSYDEDDDWELRLVTELTGIPV